MSKIIMLFSEILFKIQRRVWSIIVERFYNRSFYPLIYKSNWHALIYKQKKPFEKQYLTAVPNRGAGIGHQLANWIAGYWFSKQFGLTFAHIPFAQQNWEFFFGFGESEISADELCKNQGYKKVFLPLFNENDSNEIERTKKIIDSYGGQRVVFVAEQDQSYRDQFGVMDDIKNKFYHAEARKTDKLLYSKEKFNIAIHIRRGDIVVGQTNKNQNLLMRWQKNDYFMNVLSLIIDNIKVVKPLAIYLFSQGDVNDFNVFRKFENIQFCLDMNPQDSFLHMVNADLLITSKSSFSYKPALLSNGIKVCPKDFWHGYPRNNLWILVEKDGSISKAELYKLNQFASIRN